MTGDEPHQPEKTLRGRDLIGLGGLLAAAVIAGLVIGLVVDELAGTEPAFVLVGIAIGIIAGCIGFWVRVRSALR
jgi:F0F1-type ATP synthase assembly protein I